MAGHRLVLAAHVQERLRVSGVVAYRRLRGLVGAGLLSYARIFHAQPGVYRVTEGGLALAGSALPVPRVDLRTYAHDLGIVWVALAFEADAAASGDVVLSERELRSRDRRAGDGGRARLGVLLAGAGPAGRARVHYPDLAILDGEGRRIVAVELELTCKGPRRLERILAAYARDRELQRVIYVTERSVVARAVARAAVRAGAEGVVETRSFASCVGEPGTRVSLSRFGKSLEDKEGS